MTKAKQLAAEIISEAVEQMQRNRAEYEADAAEARRLGIPIQLTIPIQRKN